MPGSILDMLSWAAGRTDIPLMGITRRQSDI